MYRIDSDGSVSGQFTDGNPQTGQQGTVVPAAYLTELQETLCRAIELAGIVLEKGNHDQLYTAIRAIAVGVGGVGSGPGAVPTTRALGVSGLVTGGGDLSSDRSFGVPAASAADVVAGTRSDAAITPASLASVFTGGSGATQSCTLPGGLTFKWGGTDAYATEGLFNVSFDPPFAVACFRVILTGVNSTGSNNRDVWPQLVSRSKDGFTGFAQWTGGGSTVNSLDGIDWFAIGH